MFGQLDFRLSDWYAEFRKTALAVVARNFDRNDNPDVWDFSIREDRAAFCQSELKNGDDADLPLVYADYENRTVSSVIWPRCVYTNIFLGTL